MVSASEKFYLPPHLVASEIFSVEIPYALNSFEYKDVFTTLFNI